MAAPNISSPTRIDGDTALLALTGSVADIIAAVATGHAFHVQACFCANKTAVAHPVTIYHKRSGTSYEIAYQMSVPANGTINVLDGKPLWLKEGDSLTGLSDASTQIVVTAPYEDFS